MKREDLEERPFCTIIASSDFPFYAAPEADAVMDAYEQRIKELESQLENVQNTMYTENVDANMALVKANEHIKELEAEVKKWKQDNRYLSAFIHLLYKGKDANSTAVIAVANKMDELEAEKHPEFNLKQLLAIVPTHYSSVASAEGAIRRYAKHGIIKQFWKE